MPAELSGIVERLSTPAAPLDEARSNRPSSIDAASPDLAEPLVE